LSAKVRELAVRSHRVISAQRSIRKDLGVDQLRELRRQVDRLQRKVRKHRMTALALYVDALSSRIDDRLDETEDPAGTPVP
jgi:hypothetical protein